MDFDTTPFQARYQWLGYHAREMVYQFLQDCLNDPESTLDVFAFDLDEPDVIRMLEQLGPRLRAVLDNCHEHKKHGTLEPQVWTVLQQSAGADHIKLGHFTRFSHSKVFIQVKNGTPIRVLAGSANFSIRGLYVQANNVFVFDSPDMASFYENAFQTAFTNMRGFINSPVAQQWFDLSDPGNPPIGVCFSPHIDPTLSLGKAAYAIQHANSSVMFAVMELGGGGDVLADLLKLGSQTNVFAYGVTQSTTGITVYPPGSANALLTDFDALDKQVPAPFAQEWRGGVGQVIHDKFVVVDFNDQNPMLFTGSSNLSAGGEKNNGDNMIAIYDPVVVQAYAVEAIRLVDHYDFRARQNKATVANPLQLQSSPTAGQEWWRAYYDPNNIKNRERTLFIG
jgi:phosphatidylserine/phosphatidylglycerophosphate/cardiolipin synthase-like enzyme